MITIFRFLPVILFFLVGLKHFTSGKSIRKITEHEIDDISMEAIAGGGLFSDHFWNTFKERAIMPMHVSDSSLFPGLWTH